MTETSLIWHLTGMREELNCRIFTVETVRARSEATGSTGTFYVLRCPDWINIIPITPDGQVVFVRQFRPGTREVTLEIPGGMVDPSDSNPMEAAEREMLEESGYRSDRVEVLGKIHPNPAIQDNHCHTFVAFNARKVQEPTPDGQEELETVLLPLGEVPGRIASGEISHALVVVAFTFFFGLGRNKFTDS